MFFCDVMGSPKNKLAKFAEFDAFDNTFDYTHETRGRWKDIFGNQNPIIVEFACGKGEYCLGLAKLNPHFNYIGIDIKGNRLWKGAKTALEHNLNNVKFLRIQIDNALKYFAPGEIHEAWITFPDPQPQKRYKRLCSGRFLNIYREIMSPQSKLNIKTDSDLFYKTALEQVVLDNMTLEANIHDVYALNPLPEFLNIQTFYERIWLKEGKKIKYLRFVLGNNTSSETKKILFEEDMPLPPLTQTA
jgi:tRNA (guanine-N7-)-methyltransferase